MQSEVMIGLTTLMFIQAKIMKQLEIVRHFSNRQTAMR